MAQRGLWAALVGRSFVHPVFDDLLIGGGLSPIATTLALLNPSQQDLVDQAALPYFMLLSNSTHFASSPVRLDTKPGAALAIPFHEAEINFAQAVEVAPQFQKARKNLELARRQLNRLP